MKKLDNLKSHLNALGMVGALPLGYKFEVQPFFGKNRYAFWLTTSHSSGIILYIGNYNEILAIFALLKTINKYTKDNHE